MANGTPRILVVEDSSAIRDLVTSALRAEGYEVREEADGFGVESVAREFEPDLALLDVRLPVGPNGFSIARLLRSESDVPIIFLTAADDVQHRLTGFEAGADDYVAKPFSVAELLARIRAVLKRSGRLDSGPWKVGDLIIDEDTCEVRRHGDTLDLTRKEFDLLVTLGRKPGRVLAKSYLLNEIWGLDEYDPNLVEVHISSLRRKLQLAGCEGLIKTVRGSGYVVRV